MTKHIISLSSRVVAVHRARERERERTPGALSGNFSTPPNSGAKKRLPRAIGAVSHYDTRSLLKCTARIVRSIYVCICIYTYCSAAPPVSLWRPCGIFTPACMYVCTIWTRSREFPDVKRTRDAGNSPFGVTARRGMYIYIYIYRRRAGLAFYIRAACVENKTPFRAVGSALLSVCVKTRARMLRVCIFICTRSLCCFVGFLFGERSGKTKLAIVWRGNVKKVSLKCARAYL